MAKSPTITLAQLKRLCADLRRDLRHETVEFRRIARITMNEIVAEAEKLVKDEPKPL